MCGYRGLRRCQILIAFLNLIFYYALTITGIVIAASDEFVATTQINIAYILLGVLTLVSVSIGVVQGFCGSIKEDKYCMLVHLVFTSAAGFFIFILVITSAGILGGVRDNLQTYCDGGEVPLQTRGLDFYDSAITQLGYSQKFCHYFECACTLPSLGATVEHRYARYNEFNTYQTHSIFSQPDKNIRMQQCKNLFQTLVTDKNGNTQYQDDQILLTAFYFMREIEEQNKCAGICYRSNVAVASDSSNSEFMNNFNNNGASCLEHVKDHAQDILRSGTIIFAVILVYSIVTLIFTGLFTCHKELKYNLVEINWNKRAERIMKRLGMRANQ